MKKAVLAAAVMAASLNANADNHWNPVEIADGGVYYTSVDVETGRNTSVALAVYADPSESCSPFIRVFGFEHNRYVEKAENPSVPVQFRVDSNGIKEGDAYMTMYTDDSGMAVVNFGIRINDEILNSLKWGKKAIFRFQTDVNEWSSTSRFPLEGSSTRLTQMMQLCAGDMAGDWGNDEWGDASWRRNQSENEWSS